jgi:hypothetical protein
MPQFSGSFSGKAGSYATLVLQDAANHEMGLIEISGPQTSSDPLWAGATVSYWGVADLTAGSGTQTGYFMNWHPNGEISRGTFSGRITTAADGITMEGTWTMSGGTGSFSSIIGNGTYRGVITSATTVEVNWEGAYQLG